jgi:hypothetical protein
MLYNGVDVTLGIGVVQETLNKKKTKKQKSATNQPPRLTTALVYGYHCLETQFQSWSWEKKSSWLSILSATRATTSVGSFSHTKPRILNRDAKLSLRCLIHFVTSHQKTTATFQHLPPSSTRDSNDG